MFIILLITSNIAFAINFNESNNNQSDLSVTQLDLNIDNNVTDGNCTDIMCNDHGFCNSENTECICDYGYITFNSNDTQCNYEQKKVVTAFWLSFFFLGVGGGQWYMGNNGWAIAELVYFFIGLYVSWCITAAIYSDKKYELHDLNDNYDNDRDFNTSFCTCCIWRTWLGILGAWWITELVIIGQGEAHDGNGAPIPGF
jgi:TM2 domain-containing membrane protein YozV